MVDELGSWPVEEIPDANSVLMRAHRQFFWAGELAPGVFRYGSVMSVNWDKYASAEETRKQAKKNPDDNAVICMSVAGIRRIENLAVNHTPQITNRAHTDVCGFPNKREEFTQIRVLLLRISIIVIPLTYP